ncbi:MAG: thiamine phosphate synthase [Nitrospinae bacterium]|nr:thiamine phosphate synthase [Nitrospinota bacterium]
MIGQFAPARSPANLRLYAITDRSLFPEGAFLPAVETALKSGIRALQLREKDLSAEDLLALARQVKELTRRYGAWLFINDRADVARIAGAEGVHLPESGLPVGEVRKSFPELLIGASTHSLERARRAQEEGADFIVFGPVFDTPSKRAYGPPRRDAVRADVRERRGGGADAAAGESIAAAQAGGGRFLPLVKGAGGIPDPMVSGQGLDRLREVTRAIRIPVLALGGITADKVPLVLEAGAFGAAMISGIWKNPSIEKAVFDYAQHFVGGKLL